VGGGPVGAGYEPVADEGGAVLRMRNCPFGVVAEAFPPLLCGMNLALLEGLVEGSSQVRVRMDARPGWCCVAAETSKNNEH
ncbi:transcriptional regulator, partial [Actinomadura sp. KC345]